MNSSVAARDPGGMAMAEPNNQPQPGDRLTESLLGDYYFDCDAKENFPHYEAAGPASQTGTPAATYSEEASQKACLAPNETHRQIAMGSRTIVCAAGDQGRIDQRAPLTRDQLAQR